MGKQLCSTHHLCKEGQLEGQGSPGIWGAALGGPWPSNQDTQFRSSSAATWLCDRGQITPLLEVSESSFLIIIPYAL